MNMSQVVYASPSNKKAHKAISYYRRLVSIARDDYAHYDKHADNFKALMIQLSTTSVENNTPDITNRKPIATDSNTNNVVTTPGHVEASTDNNWKKLLSQSRISTSSLLKRLDLEHHPLANAEAEKLFELRVPQPYIDKIEKGNPNDPLLLQVLPQLAEHLNVDGYTEDPLDEESFTPVRGLIHKYENRVLLISSATCAINCRYCFRRSFPYQEHTQSKKEWQAALDYILENKDIDEVILSGGDPLINSNQYLFWLLNEIDSIPHIERIRIHTRMMISLPQRIDTEFIKGVENLKTQLVIVTHVNHPNELGFELYSPLSELKKNGVLLLNQAVLLRSVNDTPEVQSELSKALFNFGIIPYYIFMLDPISGAAHFDVSKKEAHRIYEAMLSKLPGYLVPRLSVEIPGRSSKTPLGLPDIDFSV